MPRLPITGAYPADWPVIAKQVKDDADWICKRCTVPHNPDTATGDCMTVHHFDGNRSNCERWNLMALCQRCHLSVQSRVDPNTGLLFPAALWSMPYIAGFYEAGRGVPGPLYDLELWIAEYSMDCGPWPCWAPRVVPDPERVPNG